MPNKVCKVTRCLYAVSDVGDKDRGKKRGKKGEKSKEMATDSTKIKQEAELKI